MISLVILMKKKIVIYISGLFIVLLGVTAGYFLFNKNNKLVELDYNEVISKLNNKESFVLCISRTNCSHCIDYKPKLRRVANEYDTYIYFIDVDKYDKKDLEAFNSRISFDGSTPVTVFIKDGEEKTTATRIEGDVSVDRIVNKLKKNGFID